MHFKMLDKVLHFGVSGIISFAAYEVLFILYSEVNLAIGGGLAIGIGLIPGILKEASDSEFDIGDLVADITGAIAGVVIRGLM